MSIVLTRVDSRLVHGQVVETWLPALGIRHVVVADAKAAAEPLARTAMELALPPGVDLVVGAPESLDWKALGDAEGNTLVLVRSIEDLRSLLDHLDLAGLDILLNVGMVHAGEGRRAITPGLYLSRSELEALRDLVRRGVRVEARGLPSQPALTVEQLADRFEDAAP